MTKRKSPLRCAVLETPEPRNVVCSFCSAWSADAKGGHFVIGTRGAICDLCVGACVEIIADATRRMPDAGELEYLSWGVTP